MRFNAAVLSVGVVSVRVMGDLRLAELTQDNLPAAVGLRLKPGQEKFVAPVVESIAEAYVSPTAWPRVVLDGDRVVGFVMAKLRPGQRVGGLPVWHLAAERGRRRAGSRGRPVRGRRGRRGSPPPRLVPDDRAVGEGSDGPEGFYLTRGFVPTGELFGEIVGTKDITAT